MAIVNRYKQLQVSIPDGTFYESKGQVIPYRGSATYELKLTTGIPNRTYGVFVNSKFVLQVTTDSEGTVILNINLDRGENVVQLIDNVTGQTTNAYITTKEIATLHAAAAEVIETIDADTEQTLLDSRLATVSSAMIEEVFGVPVGVPNSPNYDLDTYRELLEEIRTAFRYYGGTNEGINRVIRAITKVNPLILPYSFGPRWVLGEDLMYPVPKATSYLEPGSTFPNMLLNFPSGTGEFHLNIPPNLPAGQYALSIDTTLDTNDSFYLQRSDGVGALPIGQYTGIVYYYVTYPEEPGQAHIPLTGIIPYYIGTRMHGRQFNSITVSTNTTMRLLYGQQGLTAGKSVDILFTAGAYTPANVVTTINGALLTAGIIDLTAVEVGTAPNSCVSFYPAELTHVSFPVTAGHAMAQALFDAPMTRAKVSAASSGATTIQLVNTNSFLERFPGNIDEDNTAKLTISGRKGFFGPNDTVVSNDTFTPNDPIEVVLVGLDRVSGLAQLQSALPRNVSDGELAFLSGDDSFKFGIDSPFYPPTLFNSNTLYLTGEMPTNYADRNSVLHVKVPESDILLFSPDPGDPIDILSVRGSIPGGWFNTNATETAPAPVVNQPYRTFFDKDRDPIFAIPADSKLFIPVPDRVLAYKGFKVNVSIWAAHEPGAAPCTISSLDVSFDNRATWSTFNSFDSIARDVVNIYYKPRQYHRQLFVPANATKMWIRATVTGVGVMNIHRVRVTPAFEDGLHLGSGTIPRGESKIKTGSSLLYWSWDQLGSQEAEILGTDSNVTDTGLIDRIAPASSIIDRTGVTVYNSGVPQNLFGAYTDVEFFGGTLTNMEVVLRNPARFSYVRPTRSSYTTQTLNVSIAAPYVAALDVESNEVMATSVLYENGVPMTQDSWRYNSSTEVEILVAVSNESVYTIEYDALIRFETSFISFADKLFDDLPDGSPAYHAYAWFADYDVFARPEIKPTLTRATTGVTFDSNGIATLGSPATQDKSTSVLVEDNGTTRVIVPQLNWTYLRSDAIQIDPAVLNLDSLYEFTYDSQVVLPNTDVKIKMEVKSGNGSLDAVPWVEYQYNSALPLNAGHRMRITFTGIRDIRDVRLNSLLIKGVPLLLGKFQTGT